MIPPAREEKVKGKWFEMGMEIECFYGPDERGVSSLRRGHEWRRET
jgi:hypothetical protein